MRTNPDLLQRVRIRRARAEDLPEMEWQGDLIHFRNLFSEAYAQTRMGRGEIWLADLSQSWLGRQLVIGQLILSLRFSAYGGLESAYLYGFRVKDQYRSQGVGSLMLDVVEESLRRRGCTSLLLNVAQVNNDARRLYERRRYQVMGEDEGHWFYTDHLGVSHEVHEPAWRMEKRLDLY